MIAVRQGMVVVVLEKSTEITYSFTTATATATATTETITATATIATITPPATTISNKKSKGTTSPPLPSQENVIVIFLIRNYIPSLISPFAITTTTITLHITGITTVCHMIDNKPWLYHTLFTIALLCLFLC